MSGTAPETLRLGYLGHAGAATKVIQAAGPAAGKVEPIEVPVADPFGPLRRGEVDLVLTRFTVDEPDLVSSAPLYTEDRILVTGLHHELAGRTSVSYEDVADYDVFACPPAMPASTYEQIVPGRTPAGRPVRRVRVAATVQDMVQTVRQGTAVHPTISSLASWLRHPDLVFLPINDLPPAVVALTWRRATALDEPALATGIQAFVAAALAGRKDLES